MVLGWTFNKGYYKVIEQMNQIAGVVKKHKEIVTGLLVSDY